MIRRQAFSLIEVVVAIGILGFMLTALFSLQATAARSVTYSRNVQMAALLAKDKMLELEWMLRKDGFRLGEATLSGDFSEAEAPEIQWSAEIRKVEPEALVAQAGDLGGVHPLAAQAFPIFGHLGKMLSEQLREIRLTVRWKEGRFDEEFEVVTHVVHLGRPRAVSSPSSAAPATGSTPSVGSSGATGSSGTSGTAKGTGKP